MTRHHLIRRSGAGHQTIHIGQRETRAEQAAHGGGADLRIVHARRAGLRVDRVMPLLDAIAFEHQFARPRRLAADQTEAFFHLLVADRIVRQEHADAINEYRLYHARSSGHVTRRTGRRSRPFHAVYAP